MGSSHPVLPYFVCSVSSLPLYPRARWGSDGAGLRAVQRSHHHQSRRQKPQLQGGIQRPCTDNFSRRKLVELTPSLVLSPPCTPGRAPSPHASVLVSFSTHPSYLPRRVYRSIDGAGVHTFVPQSTVWLIKFLSFFSSQDRIEDI